MATRNEPESVESVSTTVYNGQQPTDEPCHAGRTNNGPLVSQASEAPWGHTRRLRLNQMLEKRCERVVVGHGWWVQNNYIQENVEGRDARTRVVVCTKESVHPRCVYGGNDDCFARTRGPLLATITEIAAHFASRLHTVWNPAKQAISQFCMAIGRQKGSA